MKFRQKVRRAINFGLSTKAAAPADLRVGASVVLKRWSALTGKLNEANDPSSFYNFALNHMDELGLRGVLVTSQHGPSAFGLWEPPLTHGQPASSFVSITADRQAGASEFLHLSLAHAARDEGYRELCIGGSEEESLDQFKRKMDPVRSLSMLSAVWLGRC